MMFTFTERWSDRGRDRRRCAEIRRADIGLALLNGASSDARASRARSASRSARGSVGLSARRARASQGPPRQLCAAGQPEQGRENAIRRDGELPAGLLVGGGSATSTKISPRAEQQHDHRAAIHRDANVCLLNREADEPQARLRRRQPGSGCLGCARVSTQPDARGDSPVRSGSPAAQADLRPGDHVTAINLKSIASTDDFIATVDGYAPGARITLTIKHGGQAKTLRLTLGARPTS